MDKEKWPIRYIYGNFRTALNVAHRLRSRNIRCWAKDEPDGNCSVRIHPSDLAKLK